MSYTQTGLLNLVKLVARPDHDKVIAMSRRAILAPKIVRPFACGIVGYTMLSMSPKLAPVASNAALAIAVLTAALLFSEERRRFMGQSQMSKLAMVLGGIGLFVGLGIGVFGGHDLLKIAMFGAAGFAFTWIATLVGGMLTLLALELLTGLMRVLSAPIAGPVLWAESALNNRAMRRKYPSWKTAGGTPIVQFGRNGIRQVNHEGNALFFPSASAIASGTALAAGIPLFTLNEMTNPAVVNQRMEETFANMGSDPMFQNLFEGAAISSPQSFMEINPANGLPMIDGIGGIDVVGNVYGTDNTGYMAPNDMHAH
jgi:hypothetical protein